MRGKTLVKVACRAQIVLRLSAVGISGIKVQQVHVAVASGVPWDERAERSINEGCDSGLSNHVVKSPLALNHFELEETLVKNAP
jgi:hypothetical protein